MVRRRESVDATPLSSVGIRSVHERGIFLRHRAKGRANAVGQSVAAKCPQGEPLTGRIVKLLVGQGHGFIRLPNEREIYFHRADLQEGSAFNDLHVGDTVRFELLEDPVSGPRALGVRQQI